MDIKVGQFYKNKTFKYLIPVLKDWSINLVQRLNSVNKFAFGIHDAARITEIPSIYVLIDKAYKTRNAKAFLDWIRADESYLRDYQFGSKLDSRFHMVVLKIPPTEVAQKAYHNFMQGHYSKMYAPKDLPLYFKSESEALEVLCKSAKAYNSTYKEEVRDILLLNTDNIAHYEELSEVSLPLYTEHEVFNAHLTDYTRTFITGFESLKTIIAE